MPPFWVRSPDSPDIVVLPPVLVGATLLGGAAIHYLLWPTTLLPVVPARIAAALLFIASGVVAYLAEREMHGAGTNVLPTRPALALVTGGPFRWTRNPLYVAAIGVALGVSLWVNGVFPLVLLAPMSLVMHYGVVLREERYLLDRFGAEYEAYCARVPRWIGW